MKSFVFMVLSFFISAAGASTSNLNKDGVILEGYDVVSYFKSARPLKGSAQIKTQYQEATYWFSSEENKQLFLKDPAKYQPQFGGWCAYAVADSKSKVEVDPQSFLIQDGRLLLFYNGIWADTRKKWQQTKNKDAKTFLKQADQNWPETKTKEP